MNFGKQNELGIDPVNIFRGGGGGGGLRGSCFCVHVFNNGSREVTLNLPVRS